MSSVNKDIFISSILISIHSISVSPLTTLDRISSTMLNKNGERGHFCLGLGIERKDLVSHY